MIPVFSCAALDPHEAVLLPPAKSLRVHSRSMNPVQVGNTKESVRRQRIFENTGNWVTDIPLKHWHIENHLN